MSDKRGWALFVTAQVQIITLHGVQLPEVNGGLSREPIGNDKFHDADFLKAYDRHTLFYDCFQDWQTGETLLLGPPLLNLRDWIEQAEISADGTVLAIREIRDLSRCCVVALPPIDGTELRIQHGAFDARINIGRPFVEDFRGLNGIYTISKNNRLEWIADWLDYYVREHGLDAVLLADNGSTDYALAELAACIQGVEGLKKAVVLDAPFPFGPTAENNTAYSALFLQRALAELGRLRFFAKARAVMNADIDELVHSASGKSVFDLARYSDGGYVRADAQWVYADVNTLEGAPRHKDHRFVSASGKPRSNRKWCVVPDGPQEGRQWLTHFLGNRKDPVEPDLTLWHFRQVSTGWKYARSDDAPELVEDVALAETMSRVFTPSGNTNKELTAPDRVRQISPERTVPRCLIATCMKDEGPFILEWLAWHKSIGISDIVVFTNDCTDGTLDILDRLDDLGELRHLPNPALVSGSTYFQPVALSYVPLLPDWRRAEYFISIDVDEFINVRAGRGHMADLFEAAGAFDALSMSELNHGANGQMAFQRGLMTEQFPRHQTERPGRYKALRGVKTITRISDKLEKPRNHRPDFLPAADGVVWLDGSGRPLETLKEDPSLNGIDVRGSYELVVLDHFPLRSLESFLVKMYRGDVVKKDKSVSERYWRLRNRNETVSSTFERQQPEFRAYYERLISDERLSALHEASCEVHTRRAADLLQQEEYIRRKDWILANAWSD